MDTASDKLAFPLLSESEINAIRPFAKVQDCPDGCQLFKAGDAEIDFFIVLEGSLDVLNPSDNNSVIVSHGPHQFAGDIDLLTRRPVIVSCIAKGKSQLLRVPGGKVRELLNRIPHLGEKILVAFQARREMLSALGNIGFKIIGPIDCKDTNVVREFLYKNFVPFTYFDTATDKGKEQLQGVGNPKKTPAIVRGDGNVMLNPCLRDLAKSAGICSAINRRMKSTSPSSAQGHPTSPPPSTPPPKASTRLSSTSSAPAARPAVRQKSKTSSDSPAASPAPSSPPVAFSRCLNSLAILSAPVVVDRIDLAKSNADPHLLHLDCGDTVRAGVVLLANGVTLRLLEA